MRIRIEILILFVIYFAFFTTRLSLVFTNWLHEPDISAFGLQQFLSHIILLLIAFSIPFIHINLIPKQKGFVHYRTLPLNPVNSFSLVFSLHYKYQLIGLVFILPVFVSLIMVTNLFLGLYFLVSIFLYQIIFILFCTLLTARINSRIKVIVYYEIFMLLFFTGYALLYFYTLYFIWFDPLFIILALFYLITKWKTGYTSWDLIIKTNTENPVSAKNKRRIFTYDLIQKFRLPKINALLAKEWLNYLRNPKYLRILFISFFIYCLLLMGFLAKVKEDFLVFSSILTMLYIWQHFSLQFNEKYLKADSAVIMKTFPIKYYQIWMAKFFAEFVFVLFLLIFLIVFWLVTGFGFDDIYQLLSAIFLFALMVLATIINFKLIFYDRPRFAGYAYHFFIIFVAVMSANYYLVGPFIALVLLIYFTFYSYREFVK